MVRLVQWLALVFLPFCEAAGFDPQRVENVVGRFIIAVMLTPVIALFAGFFSANYTKEEYSKKRAQFIKKYYENRKFSDLSKEEISVMEKQIGNPVKLARISFVKVFLISGILLFIGAISLILLLDIAFGHTQ